MSVCRTCLGSHSLLHSDSCIHTCGCALIIYDWPRQGKNWVRKPQIHGLSFLPTKADTQKELLISWVTRFLVKIFYCSIKFIVLLKTPFPGNCHSLSKRKGRNACPGLGNTYKCSDSQSLTVSRQPSVSWALCGSSSAQPSKPRRRGGWAQWGSEVAPFSADGSWQTRLLLGMVSQNWLFQPLVVMETAFWVETQNPPLASCVLLVEWW